MNSTGNPNFKKIRNCDNTALNVKKAETADVGALATYDQLVKLKDDPKKGIIIKRELAKRPSDALSLKMLIVMLDELDVPPPSRKDGAKWHPNSITRLRKRIMNLKGVDILKFWSE
jgi:hypothetical protein